MEDSDARKAGSVAAVITGIAAASALDAKTHMVLLIAASSFVIGYTAIYLKER